MERTSHHPAIDADRQVRFMHLFLPIRHRLVLFARAMTRTREDAEDLVGETVLAAYRTFDRIRDHGAFPAYLFTTATRINAERTRRSRRFDVRAHDAFVSLPCPSVGPDIAADVALLHRALARLPERTRETVVLFEIADLSLDAIQRIQGGSLSGVKSRVVRGRAQLTAMLAEDESTQRARALPLAAFASTPGVVPAALPTAMVVGPSLDELFDRFREQPGIDEEEAWEILRRGIGRTTPGDHSPAARIGRGMLSLAAAFGVLSLSPTGGVDTPASVGPHVARAASVAATTPMAAPMMSAPSAISDFVLPIEPVRTAALTADNRRSTRVDPALDPRTLTGVVPSSADAPMNERPIAETIAMPATPPPLVISDRDSLRSPLALLPDEDDELPEVASAFDSSRTVSVTAAPIAFLFTRIAQVSVEYAFDPTHSIGAFGGLGYVSTGSYLSPRTAGGVIGAQANCYLVGDFEHGMQLGLTALYSRFDVNASPDFYHAGTDVSAIAHLGYKLVLPSGLTGNVQAGLGWCYGNVNMTTLYFAMAHSYSQSVDPSIGPYAWNEFAESWTGMVQVNIGYSF
jgi:RNA polymerase sigma-70 factor, ECF subfamily